MDTLDPVAADVEGVAAETGRRPARLLAARIALAVAVVADPRRRAPTDSVRFGPWVVFVVGLYWTAFDFHIFATPNVDALFKAWLTIFLLVNTLQIAAWLWRNFVRVHVPAARPF